MMTRRNAGDLQLTLLMHLCVTLSLSSLVSRPRIQVLAGLLGHVGAKIQSLCVEVVHA